ncbi:Hint domain-containing protein [Thalassovita taeanensis]|uniref:Ca2+-binding protein, RTX toxin-related n=1 Tax=Thalassovita taeanensis TaxID=657014 RepID=A0A1H8YX68_9RHOB|nr:Hint domain-containing protein [Thalassovita taeanensis]SEP56673.1 Ca2+-binding protein, RTX toxin-related [Thalassovita taeanensis]
MSTSFIAYGIDVVANPSINALSGAGNQGQGQITVTGGSQPFSDTQIIEVLVENEQPNGELDGSARIVGIRVYDSQADFDSGTVLYTYEPQNPGQYANVQSSLDGLGDSYIRFNSNVLISSDPGAPPLNSLLIAPGTDANDHLGSLTIDRYTDTDFDGDGTIDPGTIETANGQFNANYSQLVYGPTADGIVTGSAGGDVMSLGYTDPSDGDQITTGDDTIDGGGGNDQINGETGDDVILGGGGDDTITLTDGFGNDTITGGETGEVSGDVLDASTVTSDLTFDLSGSDTEAGTVSDGTGTTSFSEIENLVLGAGTDTLVLGDAGGARVVENFTAPTNNWNGTYTGYDQLNVAGLTDATGAPVDTQDVTVSDDGAGNAVLGFPNGESLTLIGIAPGDIDSRPALIAMGIPDGGLDYVVEGTDGADVIDTFYTGDLDGDMVDAADALDGSNDDVIIAGAGDDTVLAGEGDDSIEGGLGHDQLEGGEGNDTLAGGAGDDIMYGGVGDDLAIGGDGADSFEGYDGADVFYGGDGDDWVNGDRGDDTLFGGAGDDWMRASYGNDSLEGGTGDDYIWSGYGDDTIRLENDFGNDTIEMEGQEEVTGDILDISSVTDDLTIDLTSSLQGVGTISDGVSTATFEGVEHLVLGSGSDTLVLGDVSGSDTVEAFSGPTLNTDGSYSSVDRLDVSALHDQDGNLVDTGDVMVSDDGAGNAVLRFPNGEQLTLIGVAPEAVSSPQQLEAIGIPPEPSDGIVSGSVGDDLIDVGYDGDPQGDVVDGGDANLPGESGDDDIIQAGAGNDTVLAGAGNDEVLGELGDDSMDGGIGDDALDGGAGGDTLSGGAGNDTLTVSSGDLGTGGDGDDVFYVDNTLLDTTTFQIDGGAGGETLGDTLHVTGPATITYDALDPEGGTVEWLDGSILRFDDIENVIYVPCFTMNTRIKTIRGEIRAGELQVGERVLTRDDGFQPVRWIGRKELCEQDLIRQPELRPVLISAGVLGPHLPERDLLVSPQHRMLISGPDTQLWFGEEEVFVAAIHLRCLEGVEQILLPTVTYVHFMFDQHQIVQGDGAWSESFQPGDLTLMGMDQAQRDELFALFPALQDGADTRKYPAARSTLSAQEARVLLR